MRIRDILDRVKQITGRNDDAIEPELWFAFRKAVEDWCQLFPWPDLYAESEFQTSGDTFQYLPAEVDRVLWLYDVADHRVIQPGEEWETRYPSIFERRLGTRPQEWRLAGTSACFTTISVGQTFGFTIRPHNIYAADDSATGATVGLILSWPPYASALDYDREATVDSLSFYVLSSTGYSGTISDALGRVRLFQRDINYAPQVPLVLYFQEGSEWKICSYIQPYREEARFLRLQLLPIPPAGLRIRYGFLRRPPIFRGANDIIPPWVSWEYVLWKVAAHIFWLLREGSRATAAEERAQAVAERRIIEVRQYVNRHIRALPEQDEYLSS